MKSAALLLLKGMHRSPMPACVYSSRVTFANGSKSLPLFVVAISFKTLRTFFSSVWTPRLCKCCELSVRMASRADSLIRALSFSVNDSASTKTSPFNCLYNFKASRLSKVMIRSFSDMCKFIVVNNRAFISRNFSFSLVI